MPEFDRLFSEIKEQTVLYNDEVLMRIDKIPVPKKFKLSVILISTNSEWQQAIKIKTKGKIVSQGSNIISDYFILWEKYLREEAKFDYDCLSKNNELIVWNAWDHGDGVVQAWLRGAAMKKEIIAPNHFRYYCNDGHPDANFDDIIFDVIINPNQDS